MVKGWPLMERRLCIQLALCHETTLTFKSSWKVLFQNGMVLLSRFIFRPCRRVLHLLKAALLNILGTVASLVVVVLLVLPRDQSSLSCQEVTGFKFTSLQKYRWGVFLSLREELIHQITAVRMQLECLTLYWGSKQLKGAQLHLFACALYVSWQKILCALLVYIIGVQLFTACDHDKILL